MSAGVAGGKAQDVGSRGSATEGVGFASFSCVGLASSYNVINAGVAEVLLS